ncbi:S-adenosyl-L-methionine-dependent methyltransferase [Emericellopsis atlantica]|uniref:S-adenosyl-L-methionine-dependent methyltransferase n=1 Tax=Emericellopsis atlantica TaxID=2614577 RepID=A0A9P7ZHW0_9HYPO|nr:S-adenosyl-L-methionine-dependent methyltransferase [Emericellopsis atlantica]KAG9251778.1 S-adenosyl-L-methionine-dependent methyltransferase [Emericellopsis atlantica]
MASPATAPDSKAGTSIYNPHVLNFYDAFVLGFSNDYAWKCPTETVLLPLFQSAIGKRHLDVGVGTGYFPATAVARDVDKVCQELTLLDLNPNTLQMAKQRVESVAGSAVRVDTVTGDATQALPLEGRVFDGMSLFYLLHCMPGPTASKLRVLDMLRPHLAPGGTLVGATILGEEAAMNPLARLLMSLYNWKGIFGNWEDNKKEIDCKLRGLFADVETWVVGRVMLFRARKPLDVVVAGN